MAHRRRPLARAFLLNTIVLVVELVGGVQASSLSLIIDGVHNLSDEMALGFLVLAYTLRTGLSGRLLRTANLFNSVGLYSQLADSCCGECSNACRSQYQSSALCLWSPGYWERLGTGA